MRKPGRCGSMLRRSGAVAVLALPALLAGGLHATAAPTVDFTPGAAGAGDPYFPLDGNGGYDVGHYLLDLRYDPVKHRLAGTAAITATATQNLSRFNLDFVGLTVRAVTIGGAAATWTRTAHELVITPPAGIPDGSTFTARVRYDGVPAAIADPSLGPSGVLRTPGASRSWASRTWPRAGSRPTTTPSTRPPTRSASPCPRAGRWSPTASSRRPAPRTGRPPSGGRPRSRWRPTWRRSRPAGSTWPPTAPAGCATGTRWTPRCCAG